MTYAELATNQPDATVIVLFVFAITAALIWVVKSATRR